MAHRLSPKKIALWRYEQILPALGDDLTKDVRGEIVRELASRPVRWPSGGERRISAATLYRWLQAHRAHGLTGLRPASRRDKGKSKGRLPAWVVDRAMTLLGLDEELPLTLLLALLQADEEVKEAGIEISRSTLHRQLSARPRYVRLKKARKKARHRRRFVAREPHGIWHCDAKGPIRLRLADGRRVSFHVLTILDDATRAVLAVIVAPTPDLLAAVFVFRRAARRWGLPRKLYLDRASIFDSWAFREGLAELGSHRIETEAGNAEAHGKIEAYHRLLVAWFVDRLPKQRVIDSAHLQQLLEAVIELYQDHHHREIKTTPRKALADRTSPRAASAARLDDAFREEKRLKAHAKTGEVDLRSGKFGVPEHLRGKRLVFRVDRDPRVLPVVVDPATGEHLPLVRLHVRPEDLTDDTSPRPAPRRWAEGPLQRLHDAVLGRPQAEPGFGLPEILSLLSRVAGRPVPRSDREEALVQRVYREIGPLARQAAEAAFADLERELGTGRPLQLYLDALRKRVPTSPPPRTTTKKRRRSR
ncbi:MAG: transposase family protein [Planctomycetota bacterium]|nr:transposase family protein [Planctomycetota bacterium]